MKVDNDVIEFSKKHSITESFLYNNRLYLSIINPTDDKIQYSINR